MSAFKNNPFLVGFSVVMVLGVGALGYLTYSAAEEHGTARTEFEDAAGELNRLQSLRPFPNDEHLKKFQQQRDELQVKVDGLQQKLAASKIKIEPITPTAFQDKLRETVARVTGKAPESAVTLPTDFYMGMKNYQSEPPNAQAAPPLYRELRAIEAVMNVLLDAKNVQLRELTRSKLTEEQDAKPAAPDPKNKNKGSEPEGRKIVEKDTFTIKFAATQENFQRILNGIVTHKEQFFIPRYITVTNEKQDAPPKVLQTASAPPPSSLPEASAAPDAANPTVPGSVPAPSTAPADPAAAAPADPATQGPKLEYIYGKELVEVTMDIELVDVQEPASKDQAKK